MYAVEIIVTTILVLLLLCLIGSILWPSITMFEWPSERKKRLEEEDKFWKDRAERIRTAEKVSDEKIQKIEEEKRKRMAAKNKREMEEWAEDWFKI